MTSHATPQNYFLGIILLSWTLYIYIYNVRVFIVKIEHSSHLILLLLLTTLKMYFLAGYSYISFGYFLAWYSNFDVAMSKTKLRFYKI